MHELHRLSDEEFVEKYKDAENLCSLYEEKALLSGILQLISGVVFSTVELEYKYLYGDYIKPNQRLLSRVKKLFKRVGMF